MTVNYSDFSLLLFFLVVSLAATVVFPDTVASLPIFFTILGPIPLILVKSLTDLKLPCSLRYLIMAVALFAPIPFNVSSSALDAVLMLTAAKALKLKVSAISRLRIVFGAVVD